MSARGTRGDEHAPDPLDLRLDLAEQIVGHRFADRELLRQAITHPSATDERDPLAYYERLEFLGDAIVGFLIAEEVFRRFPELPEGDLTRIRIAAVSGTALSSVAADLGLADVIVFGPGEAGTSGRGLVSALENAFEALTGALYLDAGLAEARGWVLGSLGALISPEAAQGMDNPKSRLQELMQATGSAPVYRILRHEGPPHDRTFLAEVSGPAGVLGTGTGRSKQKAEAAAAATALEHLIGPASGASEEA